MESRFFIVVAFLFPGNTVTIILDNYPPSTLEGVGLGGRKNPRIIVAENYCHFGASQKPGLGLGSRVVTLLLEGA